MTKKDYIKIADILGNKLASVKTWDNTTAYSLALAYTEDFMNMLKRDNTSFDKARFIDYINNTYNLNIAYSF
jgi:hypothetical protein